MNRYDLVKEVTSRYPNGVYVEIGTDRGAFAEFILNNSSCKKLYCIDPYVSYPEYNDAINNITGDALYNYTQAELSKYDNRVELIRKFSEHAVTMVPDDIDFLYIDGNHSYKYVLNDLNMWYDKVKVGGTIVSDDAIDVDDLKRDEDNNVVVTWCPGSYGHYGVIAAVKEFSKTRNISYELIGNQVIITK